MMTAWCEGMYDGPMVIESEWQWQVPSGPPGHAGQEGMTRGGRTCSALTTWSRGTATMMVSMRRRGMMALWTRTAPTDIRRTWVSSWAMAHMSQPFGRRWEAVGQRRKSVRSSAWLPISTRQRPITWRAPGPGATVCSLWTGLTRNPWWCSHQRSWAATERQGP